MLCQARAREALAAGAKAAEAAAERELALGEELKVRRENSPREFAGRIRRENSLREFAEIRPSSHDPFQSGRQAAPHYQAVKSKAVEKFRSNAAEIAEIVAERDVAVSKLAKAAEAREHERERSGVHDELDFISDC